jgi:predicted nucleotidyltransferase
MKIDYRTPICGVLPSVLKQLFHKHGNYSFSVKEAAKAFGESETAARERLKCLHSEGWTDAEGVLIGHKEHVPGLWMPTDNGLRLAATPMLKRFPVSEGREIVKRVIEVAQEENSKPWNSKRITKIVLFGSVLVGKDTDDAGDVDLDVTTSIRKDIPYEEMCRLAKLENEGRVHNLNLFYWGDILLARRIKKVSRRISLLAGIINPDWPQRVIYQFDSEAEEEILTD